MVGAGLLLVSSWAGHRLIMSYQGDVRVITCRPRMIPQRPRRTAKRLLAATEESSLSPTTDGEMARLEKMVRDRTAMLSEALGELQHIQRELWLAQNETIHSLSVAAEFRDDETSKHIER